LTALFRFKNARSFLTPACDVDCDIVALMLWEKILCEQWHSARIFQHDTQLFGDLSPGTVQHSL
jgi:hypothetical protein